MQAVDDVLFYFDYKQGVHRFDGASWEKIPIPPELLQREFRVWRPALDNELVFEPDQAVVFPF